MGWFLLLYRQRMAGDVEKRGAAGKWEGDYLSVKNQRFLTASLQGEARALPRQRKVLGAEVEGEVFGTGDPSPTRGREVGRIRRGAVRGWEIVLHTSSVKNQRFLTASPQGEAKGRCRARGRHWARRKAERWRAITDRPYERTGDWAGVLQTAAAAACKRATAPQGRLLASRSAANLKIV